MVNQIIYLSFFCFCKTCGIDKHPNFATPPVGSEPSVGFGALTGCCGKCKACGKANAATILPDVNDEDARHEKRDARLHFVSFLQEFEPADHEAVLKNKLKWDHSAYSEVLASAYTKQRSYFYEFEG